MQRKIFLNIVVVLLAGVIICGLLSARVVEENLMSNIERDLTIESGLVRVLVGESLISNSADIDAYIKKIKQTTNTRVTILDVLGNVLVDTEKESSAMDNHSKRAEVAAALKGEVGKSIRYSYTLKVDLMYIAQPIYSGGSIVGVVRLAKPLYEIKELVNKLYLNIFIAVLVGLLAASLLGYRMSILVTRPVKEITYAAERISKGQFDKQIIISSKDEVGILANSINDMASKLNETFMSLQDKNLKLEAIMSSVVNGIIAIDSSEKILFINPVAIRILNINEKDAVGKHLLQVVRNNAIDKYMNSIIKDRKFFDTEITLEGQNEKILKFYANPIRQTEKSDMKGIIITIQDITELRKLERMRTEFVANVSHELKTPLTSIKGFVETLKMNGMDNPDDNLRFLGIIEDEADRLYRLINDILSLSELEQRKAKIKRESINVSKSVAEVVEMLKKQSDDKHIGLSVKLQEGMKNLEGDPDQLKQMLINLIDNAIKYTPENGMVEVEAYNASDKSENEAVIIKVRDNGIGIPQQHLPRIFERFYRVDKARSRKVGGTGLGLAIVKHVVILFNGKIEVHSDEGKGTEFTISIPVQERTAS